MQAADVQGKKILITGAASGIGAATAALLAERGASLFLSDINKDALQQQQEKLAASGTDVASLACDVSDAQSVQRLFASALEHLGGIDVCINNAGIDHTPTPLHLTDDETFARVMQVNTTGVWLCMKQALQVMLNAKAGHIINLASVAGLRSSPMIAAYAASKHAVMGLTKSAAVEYAKMNIRVNAVCPSFVNTPMVQNVLSHMDERAANALVKANPMKRLGNVEEIAYALAWLCSDESSFMTGQSVVLDGGMLA
ncbi:SDR family NAD(P)-dependent oxidoreductase [Aestuariibacter salexigens]|uniref:SDR family NAD(P)-dependent oxidoreductase n=1 Tax=Aestuariibacter salexigens TaxID=226010 RepID=UPI00040FDCC4|nr:SDR family oxidoreductase [Aestuariibacter salexigens]